MDFCVMYNIYRAIYSRDGESIALNSFDFRPLIAQRTIEYTDLVFLAGILKSERSVTDGSEGGKVLVRRKEKKEGIIL